MNTIYGIPLWKIILIVIAFLCFGAALYFYFASKMVQNTDNVIFLSNEETQDILNNDADHYYQTFHKTDLKVRKSKNIQDYLAKISKSGCNGTEENKEKILYCIKKINEKFQTQKNDTIEGVHMGKLLDLKWKIGFICDKFYENGLPHTRGDTILINNQDMQRRNLTEMCRLLIHEKVHVYQKIYKNEFQSSLVEKFEQTQENDYKTTNIRANPDIDNFIYKRKEDGKVLKSTYKKKASRFSDVIHPNNDHTLEHPFENIAYTVESLYS